MWRLWLPWLRRSVPGRGQIHWIHLEMLAETPGGGEGHQQYSLCLWLQFLVLKLAFIVGRKCVEVNIGKLFLLTV